MKYGILLIAIVSILAACNPNTPQPTTTPIPSFTPSPTPTATETPTKTPEPIVREGSEAALAGIPVGSELGKDGIYRFTAPTGVVEVGKVENGKITPEAFLSQKIYATYEEAVQNPWPADLDEAGNPVGSFMEGGPGNLCQLTAAPLPENVVTDLDVDASVYDRNGIKFHELRWGKVAQAYYDAHPDDLPVRFCGYAAAKSPFDEIQKTYIETVWEWKRPDGSHTFKALIYNKKLFLDESIETRGLYWPRFYLPDSELSAVMQAYKLTASIAKDITRYDQLIGWRDTNIVPQDGPSVFLGSTKNSKAK
jgi:hypothetical protein